MELSEEERHVLTHMLGAQSHIRKRDWGYRNHFAADKEGDDIATLETLKKKGLVVQGMTVNRLIFFRATKAGCEMVGLTKRRIRELAPPSFGA